ncbi:hypothetical protein IMCC3088_2596 [Aequoribacter fuscus]|uniref:Uncharacterized protein n=1 Tax=Aequoribacter fuscus TaxID=2518989 RepID=F3L4J5_9GAMM|nr:hypothetical protein IMCC3088_2596 [Aequoribacter fuscus]
MKRGVFFSVFAKNTTKSAPQRTARHLDQTSQPGYNEKSRLAAALKGP